MSLPEQGAKVATSVVDAMRSQPTLLAVLVLNLIIFLAIAYAVRDERRNEHEIMTTLLEKCVIPQRSDIEGNTLPLPWPRPIEIAQ